MLSHISNDWKPILEKIMLEFPELEEKLDAERETYNGLAEIYPPADKIFHAFQLCSLENLKIVIIGQDPYHQPNQAQGLAFSVNAGIKIPPSLKNIFKEIQNDYPDLGEMPDSGDLTYLATQGILLLNTTLTVRQSKPNSHFKLWKGFTQLVIDYILENKKDIIFMLWGNNAKALLDKKDSSNHHIFTAVHPSPLSANRGGWFGQNMFQKVNSKLKELNQNEILWKPI